jgi:hypothetical protein
LLASPCRGTGKAGTERIKQQAFTCAPAANNRHHILTKGDGQLPEADFLAIKNRPFNIDLTEMRFGVSSVSHSSLSLSRPSGSSNAWRSPLEGRKRLYSSVTAADILHPVCIGAEEDGFDASIVITIRFHKKFTIALSAEK